jgi:hypothetical protein
MVGCFTSMFRGTGGKKCVQVALGGYPPRAPTGPDVWNYLIRFLQLWVRCVT